MSEDDAKHDSMRDTERPSAPCTVETEVAQLVRGVAELATEVATTGRIAYATSRRVEDLSADMGLQLRNVAASMESIAENVQKMTQQYEERISALESRYKDLEVRVSALEEDRLPLV